MPFINVCNKVFSIFIFNIYLYCKCNKTNYSIGTHTFMISLKQQTVMIINMSCSCVFVSFICNLTFVHFNFEYHVFNFNMTGNKYTNILIVEKRKIK